MEVIETNGKTISNVTSFVGSLLLAYSFWRITKDVSFPGKWAVIPVLGAILIIMAGPRAWVNRTILSNRVAVWFGLISFPLYLWHWPLLSFARIIQSEAPSRTIRIAAVALSVVLAFLTYKLVERPIRWSRNANAKATALVMLMTIVGYVGYNTYDRDGFRFRFNPNISMNEDEITSERAKYWAGSLERNFQSSPTKVIVFGDSQGFDIYKSMLNDEDLGLKIFGTNTTCTSFNMAKIGTQDVNGKICQDLFDKLIKSDELKTARYLIYSFFWSKREEPQSARENYQTVVKKIKEVNPSIQIIFFGPKPLLGKSWVSINVMTKNQKSSLGLNGFLNSIKWIRDEDAAYVKELSQDLNVVFIDVNEVFCSDGCQFYADHKFSYFDQNHWTELGGAIFYRKLSRKIHLFDR